MARDPRRDSDSDSLPFITLAPNMITTIGLCSGLTAIRFIMSGNFGLAVALILFSIVIDGLDGLVARRLKATSEFGAQLDSLSDFLNFGVVPGLLVYKYALLEAPHTGGWVFVLAYSVCCCMRLARFNVAQSQAAANGLSPAKHFTGVPAPAGALMALLPVFIGFETGIAVSNYPLAVGLYLGTVGALMASRIPTFSPKSLRVARDKSIWLLIAIAMVTGFMLTNFWMSMIVFVAAYSASIFYSIIKSLRNRGE